MDGVRVIRSEKTGGGPGGKAKKETVLLGGHGVCSIVGDREESRGVRAIESIAHDTGV